MPTNQKPAGGAMQGSATAKIATKNLEIISELLFFESLANKKNAYFSPALTDPAVSETTKKHIQCHKTRYETLFKYLESHK